MIDVVKVLIVDDSMIYRQFIRKALMKIPGLEIVGSAGNGIQALELIGELQPDVVTLDLEMPGMDGLAVLKKLREKDSQTAAIMLSALTAKGAETTLKCLDEGAFDFVLKPNGDSPEASLELLHNSLTEKLNAYRQTNRKRRTDNQDRVSGLPERRSAIPQKPKPIQRPATQSARKLKAIGIGISTGGPDALRIVIPKLPAQLPVPIFIVQHMPPIFTKSLADSLNAKSALNVVEASNDELVQPGNVYIAPGGKQMKVVKDQSQHRIQITDDEPENSCKPAVDYLFRSMATAFNGNVLAAIMTGMGYDGYLGCIDIKDAGGHIIAQSEESCTVFGMPRKPVEENIADEVVALNDIAENIAANFHMECKV